MCIQISGEGACGVGGHETHPGEGEVWEAEGEGSKRSGGASESAAPRRASVSGGSLQHRVPHRSLLLQKRGGHYPMETHTARWEHKQAKTTFNWQSALNMTIFTNFIIM